MKKSFVIVPREKSIEIVLHQNLNDYQLTLFLLMFLRHLKQNPSLIICIDLRKIECLNLTVLKQVTRCLQGINSSEIMKDRLNPLKVAFHTHTFQQRLFVNTVTSLIPFEVELLSVQSI